MNSEAVSKYAIDLVFVIDVTGSMGSIIGEVKEMVKGFSDRLRETMDSDGKGLQDLWVRVITFRDLGEEGERALTASHFFELPRQESALRDFVDSLIASGGGSLPESGLEALWLAMRSPWRNVLRSRHVIVMLTDASAHPLGVHNYPSGLFQDHVAPPSNLLEMKQNWGIAPDPGIMNSQARRLIIFAPDATPWHEIGERWDNTNWLPSRAGEGCMEADMSTILKGIAKSV